MGDSPAAILFDINGNPVGTVLDGSIYRLKVDSRRTVALTAVRSSVDASTSDTLLLSSNANRLSAIIYNESDSPLHIGFGNVAVSLINYTLVIPSNSELELPTFAGEIRGIWQSSGGAARITEMT